MLKDLHSRSTAVFLLTLFLITLLFSHPILMLTISIILIIFNYQCDRCEKMLSFLGVIIPMIVLILFVNAFFNQNGSNILWQIGKIKICKEPLLFGFSMSIKLFNIFSIFSIFNTLLPVEKILDIFGGYAGKSIMVLAISAKILPQIIIKAKNLREVQRYRGFITDEKSLQQKAKNFRPLLLNILKDSLENSLLLAETMHVRAYNTGNRTSYIEQKWRGRDSFTLCWSFIMLVLFLSEYCFAGTWNPYIIRDNVNYYYLYCQIILIILFTIPFINWRFWYDTI